MSTDNPYRAPVVEAGAPREELEYPIDLSLSQLAQNTFIAWEKRRLLYNMILVVVTLGIAALLEPRLLGDVEFWALCLFGALTVNVCYFAAPLVDTCFSWLGFRSRVFRWTLFVLGTLFASWLSALSILIITLDFSN